MGLQWGCSCVQSPVPKILTNGFHFSSHTVSHFPCICSCFSYMLSGFNLLLFSSSKQGSFAPKRSRFLPGFSDASKCMFSVETQILILRKEWNEMLNKIYGNWVELGVRRSFANLWMKFYYIFVKIEWRE